jgi:hypothetical protein
VLSAFEWEMLSVEVKVSFLAPPFQGMSCGGMIQPLGNLRAGVYFGLLDLGVFGLLNFDFGVRLLDLALPVFSVSG